MKELILIVDDEPINCDILHEYLDKLGYQTMCVHSATDAWDYLENHGEKTAAILLDRMMPGMSGMDLLNKIKKTERFKSIPVILQTAAASSEEVVEGIQAGAYYYLTKPFEQQMLVSVVNTAVGDWRNYQNLKVEVEQGLNCVHFLEDGNFTFKTLDESKSLAAFLANACPDPNKVVLGISELFINAVEHGNLGITYEEKSHYLADNCWFEEVARRQTQPEHQAKQVGVAFRRDTSCIEIAISDQGDGFDWLQYEEIDPKRAQDGHGRGIAMAKLLSFDDVRYIAPGNKVICTIKL